MFKQVDILAKFIESPEKDYHLRELARAYRLSPATVKAKLEPSVKAGVVNKAKLRGNLLYTAKRESIEFKKLKAAHNIKELEGSGLMDFLKKEFYDPVIILFGSAARGEDTRGGDFDLFVLTPLKKNVDTLKYSKLLDRDIQLFVMDKKEFENTKKRSKELANNILNGTRLNGYLEVF